MEGRRRREGFCGRRRGFRSQNGSSGGGGGGGWIKHWPATEGEDVLSGLPRPSSREGVDCAPRYNLEASCDGKENRRGGGAVNVCLEVRSMCVQDISDIQCKKKRTLVACLAWR